VPRIDDLVIDGLVEDVSRSGLFLRVAKLCDPDVGADRDRSARRRDASSDGGDRPRREPAAQRLGPAISSGDGERPGGRSRTSSCASTPPSADRFLSGDSLVCALRERGLTEWTRAYSAVF